MSAITNMRNSLELPPLPKSRLGRTLKALRSTGSLVDRISRAAREIQKSNAQAQVVRNIFLTELSLR